MAIQTTSRGFHYPDATTRVDTPDVPRDIKQLAQDVDDQFVTAATVAALPAFGKVGRRAYVTADGSTWLDIGTAWVLESPGRTLVTTSLPGSPYDGQEIYFLADATAGIIYHLRYRAASASAYKWEGVGEQPALFSEVVTLETVSNLAFINPTTPGPSVVNPLAGEYMIELGCTSSYNGNANGIWMSIKFGAITPNVADGFVSSLGGAAAANIRVPGSRAYKKVIAAAGTTLLAQYTNGDTSGGSVSNRWLQIKPIRVG